MGVRPTHLTKRSCLKKRSLIPTFKKNGINPRPLQETIEMDQAAHNKIVSFILAVKKDAEGQPDGLLKTKLGSGS